MPAHLFVSDRRLKIGLVIDDSLDSTDGVQQYVLTIGAWLQARGHEVHYLTSRTNRSDISNIHSLARNLTVRFNGNKLRIPLPASRSAIRQLLVREAFDVLHIQMPYSPLLAGRIIAAADPKTAIIGTFHIVPQTRFVLFASRLLAAWCSASLRRFDSVVSVSVAAQQFARNTFGLASAVLPNTILLEPFQRAKPFTEKQAVKRILFLGRLVPRKGCQLLLQAVAVLCRDLEMPDFSVTICGSGPLAAELQTFVAQNQLSSRVTFTGFVSEADKPRYYASADIAVFPSNGGESFGIVLLEAMASGRAAVIAGDNVGYRSVLENCPATVLFDPHDPAALAEQLRQLLTDTKQRSVVAAWQKTHAKQFDVAVIGPRIEALYNSALRAQANMR